MPNQSAEERALEFVGVFLWLFFPLSSCFPSYARGGPFARFIYRDIDFRHATSTSLLCLSLGRL